MPSITGGITLNKDERKLLYFLPKLGGLGIPKFEESCQVEHEISVNLTEGLRTAIWSSWLKLLLGIKTKIWLATMEQNKEQLQTVWSNLSKKHIRLKDKNGASTWFTSLPLKNEGYFLTKQLFWDLIRIYYGWQLPRAPKFGEYGVKFSLRHVLSCKKEGFISIRQNNFRYVIFRKTYLEVFVRKQKSNIWRKV